jgi:hypothetical protein
MSSHEQFPDLGHVDVDHHKGVSNEPDDDYSPTVASTVSGTRNILRTDSDGARPKEIPYLVQEATLHQSLQMGQENMDPSYFKEISRMSKGVWEAYTRQRVVALCFTGMTGTQILGYIKTLQTNKRSTAQSVPFHDQVCCIEIESDSQSRDFGTFVPDGNEDAGRQALVVNLLHADTPLTGDHKIVKDAAEDVGYAYCQRYHVDGPIMVAALICKSLVRLVVKLGPTTGSCPPFSDLLAKVLKSDEVRGVARWSRLKYLEVTTQGSETEFLIPPSVKELVVHNAHLHNNFRVQQRTNKAISKLQKLTVDGGDVGGQLVTMVKTLVETGTVPELSFIKVEESELDSAATEALFDSCRIHLNDVLEHVVVDLRYRVDDFFERVWRKRPAAEHRAVDSCRLPRSEIVARCEHVSFPLPHGLHNTSDCTLPLPELRDL